MADGGAPGLAGRARPHPQRLHGLVLGVGRLRGRLSVLGWNTGTIGKLVFVIGLAVLILLGLRAFGVELPPSIPDGMVVAGLGFAGTVLVLIRLIDIPETFQPAGAGASASGSAFWPRFC